MSIGLGDGKIRALLTITVYRYVVSHKRHSEIEYIIHRKEKEKRRSSEKLYIRGPVQRLTK